MKTRYKIILIVGIIAVLIPGILIFGAVPLMIISNGYFGFIISSTPDSVFEKDFAKISEVNFFIEKYPNYATNHWADFLGWKIIDYDADIGKNVIHLSVKKSVLHQGVKVSAGCSVGGQYNYALNILDDNVMDYLKNDTCLEKSEPDIIDSLKIPNAERDVKLATGYKLYPGVGWVHPDDQGNQQSIYRDNPDNPGELVLDIDAMQQLTKVLDYCKQKGTGIPMHQPGLKYSNETHTIDNNTCEWEKKFIFSFCGVDGFDSKGNLNTDNSTHYWNENDCTWQKIK